MGRKAARSPMLATLGDLPSGEGWTFEVKWDGVRALTRIEQAGRGRAMTITSRNGKDVTARYPELAGLAEAVPEASLPLELDGEIVAFDDRGRPNFGALQGRMHLDDRARSAALAADAPVSYALFDVLEVAGKDVTGLGLEDRRALLDKLAIEADHVSVPPSYDDGDALLAQMVARDMEGVIAKKTSSRYNAGRRTREWIKVKPKPSQEFVIGGWTDGTGHRSESFGALLLGYYENGSSLLTYAGNVGSGFDRRTLGEISEALEGLATDENPFDDADEIRNSHFVLPLLVAEIEYGEVTADGHLRHPVFKGLRDDKPAGDVKFERKQ